LGEPVNIGDVELWVERCGQGSHVLLIAGLSDPAEAWQFSSTGSATAIGSPTSTTAGPGARLCLTLRSVSMMADDAGLSLVLCSNFALPDLTCARRWASGAGSPRDPERQCTVRGLLLWIHTPRHANGMVARIIDETLVSTHPVDRGLPGAAGGVHSARHADRLPGSEAPTLVSPMSSTSCTPPRLGRGSSPR
jgi:hypothetical protein